MSIYLFGVYYKLITTMILLEFIFVRLRIDHAVSSRPKSCRSISPKPVFSEDAINYYSRPFKIIIHDDIVGNNLHLRCLERFTELQ